MTYFSSVSFIFAFSLVLCATGASAADGMINNTPTALGAMLVSGTGVAGLIVWVVKRLINILATEMQETRKVFAESLDKMREHDAVERAKDREIFNQTLRDVLAVSGDV